MEQLILESAHDAVIGMNLDGKITYVNPAACKLFSYSKEKFETEDYSALLLVNEQFDFEKIRAKILAKEVIKPFRTKRIDSKGEAHPVSVQYNAIRDRVGLKVGISVFIRSLDSFEEAINKNQTAGESGSSDLELANQKAQKEIEAFNVRLQAKNRELQQFAYIASHDLQEPLRTISNFSELIKEDYEDKLDQAGKESLKFINDAIVRMTDLITGLLEHSKIGHNKEFKELDLNELVNNVILDLGAVIKKSKAQIELGEFPSIVGLETEMRMLFQNLISNGIKFQKSGNLAQIKLSCIEKDDTWEFSVEDNGIGIAEHQWENVFTIYQRLNKRQDYKGSGIGLAHCRKIVEIHGGTIWITHSSLGGSAFKFTIPKA